MENETFTEEELKELAEINALLKDIGYATADLNRKMDEAIKNLEHPE